MNVLNVLSSEKLASTPDGSASTYIWADYCELVCLYNGVEVSPEDIYKRKYLAQDLMPNDSTNNTGKDRGKKDRAMGVIQDAFALISLRKSILREKYPFDIDQDGQLRNVPNYSPAQYIYIVLLLASHLQYMKKWTDLTSDFEVICLYAMRKFHPLADVRLFGSSNLSAYLNPEDKFSKNKLKERIEELSEMLHQGVCKEDVCKIDEKNLGDGGLDIVGIIDMKDYRSSHPIFFGQCACSKGDWVTKQHSTSCDEWCKWLRIYDTSIQNYIFVPFLLMTNSQEWVDQTDITKNILIDRLRIMQVITDDHTIQSLVLDEIR